VSHVQVGLYKFNGLWIPHAVKYKNDVEKILENISNIQITYTLTLSGKRNTHFGA